MKKQSTMFFPTLSEEEIANIIQEVKETLATRINMPRQKKIFSVADLWNIQRNQKGFVQRRAHF